MTTAAQWLAGARVRTLPAAVAPVLVGTGAAAADGGARPARALLAVGVALALQVGVNYANDYSDGVRGTDDERVGPFRLVGSGAAAPPAVRRAALTAFAAAAALGLVLVLLTQAWWLLPVGAAAIAAAWFYTGGRSPYGYRGLGEVSVFVFFGLVATAGTQYVQGGTVSAAGWLGALAMGCFACAILVANNLRDIPTDTAAGKRTLAVRLGDPRTRRFFTALVGLPYAGAVLVAVIGYPWALLALLSAPLATRAAGPVLRGRRGPGLVPALKETGLAQLAYAALLALGLTR